MRKLLGLRKLVSQNYPPSALVLSELPTLELTEPVWSALPGELLDVILDSIVDDAEDLGGQRYRAWHATFKRQVSTMSLTCRSWAKRFRPALFSRLVLRSNADVGFIYCALRTPVSAWLAPHIHAVDLNGFPNPSCEMFCSKLVGMLPSVRELNYSIGNRGTTKHPPMGSIALRMSRQHQQLTHFSLEHYRFPSFSVFLRLLGDMQSLQHLIVFHLTWNTDVTEPDHPPSCNADFRNLSYLRAQDCQQLWPFAWIYSAAATHYRYRRRLPEDYVMPADIALFPHVARLCLDSSAGTIEYRRSTAVGRHSTSAS